MYWYEFVLIYFVSGLILVALNKLHPILPPKTLLGYAIIGIAFAALILGWWFILKPYETFEHLIPAQKDQILYATLINLPIGHLLFSYLLGWKAF
jgi:hypothetical protein